MNARTEVRHADGSTEKYRYDPKGNIISEQKQNNRAVTYKYDALNQQIYKGFDNTNYHYIYNSEQQVTTMRDGTSEALFECHTFGDLISYTDNAGQKVKYGYDKLGQLRQQNAKSRNNCITTKQRSNISQYFQQRRQLQ